MLPNNFNLLASIKNTLEIKGDDAENYGMKLTIDKHIKKNTVVGIYIKQQEAKLDYEQTDSKNVTIWCSNKTCNKYQSVLKILNPHLIVNRTKTHVNVSPIIELFEALIITQFGRITKTA